MAEQAMQAPMAPPEPEKTFWEEQGFLRELENVANGFDALQEEHILGPEIRQIVDTINNLKSVEDFAAYSNDELEIFKNKLRREIPQLERQIVQFVNQVSRARAVVFEVDFI